MKYLCLILTFISSFAFGEASDLTKGQPAPFSGVLFSPDMALDLKKQVELGELYKIRLDSLKSEHLVLQERHDKLMTSYDALAAKTISVQNDNFGKYALSASVGVLATILITFAVKGATK